MSQFDKYTTTEYVEALRRFLAVPKHNFLRDAGFVDEQAEPRKGRLPRYKEEPILALEELVNMKGERCEAPDSTIGERYRIARDYKGLSDTKVASALSFSREWVRQWGADIHPPSAADKLAELLDVPQKWLEDGGEDNLPANSHLGVRVGEESRFWREQLYNMTLSVLGEIPEGTDDVEYIQAYVEWTVHHRPRMAQAARRAGGRGHLMAGVSDPLFVPWVPIPPHETGRRRWSNEVEAIIAEELVRQPSVYAAWAALKKRGDALQIPADQYPKRISLHKRVEKEKERIEKFGVNLNAQIATSVQKYWPGWREDDLRQKHDAASRDAGEHGNDFAVESATNERARRRSQIAVQADAESQDGPAVQSGDPSKTSDGRGKGHRFQLRLRLRRFSHEYAGKISAKGYAGGEKNVEHGHVVSALEAACRPRGKTRNTRYIDLAVIGDSRADVYEVKTSVRPVDVYTGTGQLVINGACIEKSRNCPVRRYLVLPEKLEEDVRLILLATGIEVVTFFKDGETYQFEGLDE